MSEAPKKTRTPVPTLTFIEDHTGTVYVALVDFVWEIELEKIYLDRPHLNSTAFFDTDYDEEQIQAELFQSLIDFGFLKKVEPNHTAMTHINRQTNTTHTGLYTVVGG